MHPRELLEKVLTEGSCSDADVEALFRGRHRAESLWHDYKSGKGLVGKQFDSAELRKDMSAFANSDGGMLIYGVGDNRDYDEPPPPDALDRFSNVLNPSVGNGLPVPRTMVTPNGRCLIAAVARAPQLVPTVHKGTLAYFLRVGDTTAKVPQYVNAQAPEYLANDLFLGRRAQPTFEIRAWVSEQSAGSFGLRVEIENTSAVWVNDFQVHVVGPSTGEWENSRPASKFALQNVDVLPAVGWDDPVRSIRQKRTTLQGAKEIPPGSTVTAKCERISAPLESVSGGWLGALAIYPRDGVPQWFQLHVHRDRIAPPALSVGVDSVWPGRPQVGFIDRSDTPPKDAV